MHFSTKTYGHDIGLSACFRQWRANSHCNKLHGYALSIRLTFGASTLDDRNWVVDFGALKPLKARYEALFDHKTLVAVDDPLVDSFQVMHLAGMLDLVVVKAVGCEAFAKMAYSEAVLWLQETYIPSIPGSNIPAGLHVVSCEVREHGSNGAIYIPEKVWSKQ